MYSYCHVYVLLLRMRCCVYSVFIPAILTEVSRAFPSVVRHMPGYTSQRRGTVRALPNLVYCVVLYIVLNSQRSH